MWYLVTSTGKHLYLKPNKEVTFGRKKSDILLQNDESISRLHATICIKPKEIVKNNEPISTCELKDANSKYGTYIILNEKEKVEVTSTGSTLKDGDKIRFGLQHHVFTIVYLPLITVVSTFNDTDKQKLQGILDEIDGMISTEWTSASTHLTVSKAALTEKVTWAMASAVPIVNLNFWEAMKLAIDNGDKLPKPADFVPPVVESLINRDCVSLCVNEKRKTLFNNLIFLHFSVRQYKMYGKMINMAGGKSVLYSKRPLTTSEVCARNVVVLQYSDSDTTQSTQGIVPEYETIYNSLRASKRKMISETDIPLAILHCSTEKYCNPKYRFEELLKRSQLKPDSSDVLILDTQDLSDDVRVLPKIISNVPIRTNLNVKDISQGIKIIPESWDLPASSDVTSQSQDRIKTSMTKASQGAKSTPNSEISVERGPAQKIEEAQKAVKCISETKDSYETQNILRSGTLKENQNARSTSNNEISVERGPVQKVKEVQKALKYIPESKDSYETQDLLGSGTLKVSQDAKSTPNSEISVERGPAKKFKEAQKAVKSIPETKDSYKTQNFLRSGTLKVNQDAESTSNNEISVERGPAQKIKGAQKAVKCIPETKDSYGTQNFLRSGTLKENLDAESTSNNEISVERGPAQKIKGAQKAVKCIPETKDSYGTQNFLRSGTSKENQGAESTSNNEISVERGPVQKVKEIQKGVKCIPETKDSYETQNILRSGTLKENLGAKSTSSNEISVERGPVQKVKEVQKALKYIPETKDSYETQELLGTGTLKVCQDAKSTPNSEISIEGGSVQKIKEIEKAGTSKESQNARTALNSDISTERISTQREKEVFSRKTVKYIPDSSNSSQSQEILPSKLPITNQITRSSSGSDVSVDKRSTQCLKGSSPSCIPETTDSSDEAQKGVQLLKEVSLERNPKCIPKTNDSPGETEKGAQCFLQRSQRVRNKNRNLEEISRRKESMIANKGTPSNEVIELIDDDDDDEEEENKLEEILLSRGRSDKPYKFYNSVLNQEKLDKLVHDHSVVVKSPEVNRHCTPLSRVNNNDSTVTASQMERESVQNSRKRSRSLEEFDSDEDFLMSTSKRLYSNDSVPVTSPHTVKSSNTVKLSQAEIQNNLLKNSTSSIRASVNFKKFKKVYNKIPEQRITLNDMYIWNMFNVQNL